MPTRDSDHILDALLAGGDPALLDAEGELLARVVEALPAEAPSAQARARLVAALRPPTPSLTDALASLLQVSSRTAASYLERRKDPTGWEEMIPSAVRLLHLRGGPETTGALVGFVEVAAHVDFPPHTHDGQERSLVLEGRLTDLDSGGTFTAGDAFECPAGSAHRLRSGPDGVCFAVVVWGVTFDAV